MRMNRVLLFWMCLAVFLGLAFAGHLGKILWWPEALAMGPSTACSPPLL